MIYLYVTVILFTTLALFWFFAKGQNKLEDSLLEIINDLDAEVADLRNEMKDLRMLFAQTKPSDDWR